VPVLATMTILSLLGGDQELDAPFTNSTVLRSRLRDALSGDILEQSLAIADKLEALLDNYQSYVDASVDTYIAESANRYSTASQLIGQLQPADEKRRSAMKEVIAFRQELFGLLNDSQWELVFQ
jgi:hypothetical protein